MMVTVWLNCLVMLASNPTLFTFLAKEYGFLNARTNNNYFYLFYF